MILNVQNDNYYKLVLDLNDLKSLNIDVYSLLGNSSNTNNYIKDILKKLNIDTSNKIENIEIISFAFQIFNIKFSINKS